MSCRLIRMSPHTHAMTAVEKDENAPVLELDSTTANIFLRAEGFKDLCWSEVTLD